MSLDLNRKLISICLTLDAIFHMRPILLTFSRKYTNLFCHIRRKILSFSN